MSQANVLFEMVNGPVGLGIDKVSEWLEYSDFAEGGEGALATLSQTIPAGSFLLGSEIKTEVALETGDADLMNLGTAASGEEIAVNQAIGVVGTVGAPAVTALQYIASAATVHVEIEEGTWASITQGRFLVTVYYLTTHLELTKGYPKKVRS